MTESNDYILQAAAKGYVVAADGTISGPKGVLKARKCRGYWRFNFKSRTGQKYVSVHRLHAFQLFGEALFAEGICVRHLDGNPENNAASNLAIGTQSQNMFDRPAEARKEHAAKGNQKHPPEMIESLRKDHADGIPYRALSVKYGIPKSTVSYYLSEKAKRTSFTNPPKRAANCDSTVPCKSTPSPSSSSWP